MKKIAVFLLLICSFVMVNAAPAMAQGANDINSQGGFGRNNAADTQNNSGFDPLTPVTTEELDQLNPLFTQTEGGNLAFVSGKVSPSTILQRVLAFAFPISGLILLVMLVWAGFEILSGASNKKSLDAGKQRATAAVLGFVLLFTSYWIVQLIEVVFNVSIISR